MRQRVTSCSVVIGFAFVALAFISPHSRILCFSLAAVAFASAAQFGTSGWRVAGVLFFAGSLALAVAGVRGVRMAEILDNIKQSMAPTP